MPITVDIGVKTQAELRGLVSKFDARKLFNFGVAGGLNQGTELCAVYQIDEAVQFDFDLTQLNGRV